MTSELSDYRSTYLFGDRTLQSMCLVDGAVLFLEGSPQIRSDIDPAAWAAMWGGTPQNFGLKPRSSLVAVDAANGKMRWLWPNAKSGEKQPDDFRILAAPTPHRDLLIVPVQANKSLWLYGLKVLKEDGEGRSGGLRRADGVEDVVVRGPAIGVQPLGVGGRMLSMAARRSWPAGGASFSRSTPIRARFAGRFVTTGRWRQGVSRYNNFNGMPTARSTIKGWSENCVVARGPLVLLMPSDSQQLLALNRSSGEMRWRGETDDTINYCLGTVGNSALRRRPADGPLLQRWRRHGRREHDLGGGACHVARPGRVDGGRGVSARQGCDPPLRASRSAGRATDGHGVGDVYVGPRRPGWKLVHRRQHVFRARAGASVRALERRVAGQIARSADRRRKHGAEEQPDAVALAAGGFGGRAGRFEVGGCGCRSRSEGDVAALGEMLDGIEQLDLVKSAPEAALDLLVTAPGAITRIDPEKRRATVGG